MGRILSRIPSPAPQLLACGSVPTAGRAFGNESDPFANFYFGAFGNNWIDKGEISRYREYYSFPGVQINQIGANSPS